MSGKERHDRRAPSTPKKEKVLPIASSVDFETTKGLPCNEDAERLLLGSILADESNFVHAAQLEPDDFSLERHRRIFACIRHLQANGDHVDYVIVAEELARLDHLGHDGFSYLASLTAGLPQLAHLDSYAKIVLNKSILRRTIFTVQKITQDCWLETASPSEILCRHLADIQELGRRGARTSQTISDIPAVRSCGNHAVEYLREPELPRGAVIGLTGDSGSGKSTLALAWAGEAAARGTPVLVLDRENPISVVAERLERLCITDGGLLRYWGGWLPQPPPQPNHPAVLDWVKTCEPRPLVIVDSMVAFHGGDENDAGETRAFMQQCRSLADLGATVIVIHHDGKADTSRDYRGSSDFKASLDEAFHVRNLDAPDGRLGTICLRSYKSRFGFSGQRRYRYTKGQFVLEVDSNTSSPTTSERLLELLRANQGIKKAAFENLAIENGLGRQPARDFINDRVLSGKIRREGKSNQHKHFLQQERPEDS